MFGRTARGWCLIVSCTVLVAGCGTSENDGNEYGVSGSGGGGGADGGGGTSTGGTGGPSLEGGFLDVVGDAEPDASCVYLVDEGTRTPLNLYIMFDKSSSMAGGNKWDSAKAGLSAFVNDSESAGIRVALNFFPRAPDATPVCDQTAYKEPRVAFGELPQNAIPIIDAMEAESPDGFGTPTYPALGGAILKAIEVTASGESAAVLLITDGEPQGPAATCAGVDPEDPNEIAKIAASGAAYQPPVITFVIGLPGASQTVGNTIAAAGGSDEAIQITGDVEQAFRDALASVRGQALPCEFVIPSEVDDGEVEPGNVNVLYTPPSAEAETLPKSLDSCASGSWVYDDDSHPTKIMLCPSTCDMLRKDLDGKIEIMLGCKTVVK